MCCWIAPLFSLVFNTVLLLLYKSHLFYYFCRKLLFLLYFEFLKLLYFWYPRCAYCFSNVWCGRKNALKSPHFLLRRKHLAFIYLCMENTWSLIPCLHLVAQGFSSKMLQNLNITHFGRLTNLDSVLWCAILFLMFV